MTADAADTRPPARSLRGDWARLAHAAPPSRRFTADLVADLPEPARRWLTHAIPSGTPLWSSVQLDMRGQIELGSWRPFTAREVLTPPEGFIWAATARVGGLPVTGFDRYGGGDGRMRWRLLALIPVMSRAGPDVTRSAAGRLAGEGTCWLPTAVAAAARWSTVPDADTAVATWRIDDRDEAVRIRVAPDGSLLEVLLDRWGNPDGRPFGRYPFAVTVETERAFDGVTIPSAVRAAWRSGDELGDGGEFFRAEIIAATFR